MSSEIGSAKMTGHHSNIDTLDDTSRSIAETDLRKSITMHTPEDHIVETNESEEQYSENSTKTDETSEVIMTEKIGTEINQEAGEGVKKEDSGPVITQEEPKYLTGTKLIILTVSLMSGVFMIALDGQIISTAIPKITSDFDSLHDIGWYGSAYLLTQLSLQPTFGRVYTFFNVRWCYVCAILTFEIGSILCAAAPTSTAFIIGRAIAGAGASATFSGVQTIIIHSVPLLKRPVFMSFTGSMFGVASVLSPPIGGFITDTPRLTWRFCFWINLPFGALAIAVILLTFKAPAPKFPDLSLKDKLERLDFLGALFMISSMVCLFLALQWGGAVYPWSNSKVWGCLLGFGLIMGVFIASQVLNQKKAMIPYRIISKRTVILSCLFIFSLQMAMMTQAYYVPLYFQAVRGTTAAGSGTRILPYGVTITLSTFASGYFISKTGYYVQVMWLGSAIFTIGSSLLHTLSLSSPFGMWFGFEIIAGIGYGMITQIAFFAVQSVLEVTDMPSGISLVIFSQCLGGSLGLSIAQNIFTNTLSKRLYEIPGIDAAAIIEAGAAAKDIREVVPFGYLDTVKLAYNSAITTTFILAAVAAGTSFLYSTGMERKRLAKKK